jgi:ribA/ribD-fused uncharacterized protein
MQKIAEFRGEFSFLSNFHPAPVEIDGITYPTTEHAFQAAKTNDRATKETIAAKATPGQAKRAGGKRGIINDFRREWDSIKIMVMAGIVRRKFTEHEDLKAKLLATGNAILEEGNTWNDTFWGVCRGKGENWLGKILMKLREELRVS